MGKLLDRYKDVVGAEIIYELSQMAKVLKGLKIVHVNSTKTGGGVAEILTTMTQLTTALGIETHWEVINGSSEFFECTKQFHNGIQGKKQIVPSPQLLKEYKKVNADTAERLRPVLEKADIVFIHDPQPAAIINAFPNRKNKWIWRCHIDASNPNSAIWKFLRTFVMNYDASIFSLADFVQPLPHPIYLIPPSIDPLTDKNTELSKEEIESVRSRFGIDPNRPMILQVSRFDYFKDPVGVIHAYRLAKKFKHGIQLVLAGGGAPDDPEGEMVLNEVKAAAGEDPDIHVLFLPSDSHRTINALQRGADIILQKSVKEGFGLSVTEALWKNKPVIGGNCGGIRLQVIDHQTGYLVDTPEGAAERIRFLLQTPQMIEEMGEKGHRFVHDNFLITRHLRDYLTLIISLLEPVHNRRIEIHKIGHIDLEQFFKKLGNTNSLLMLDYDGTLSPHTKDRMKALPYAGIKERLNALLDLKKTRVVIVSGRSLSEVESLLDMPDGLELWGSHGLERKLSNGKRVQEVFNAKFWEGLELGKAACRKYAGTDHYEDKPFAVAMHWRGVESQDEIEAIKSVEPIWEDICKKYELEVHRFDGGVELRPKGRNKGDVIRQLLDEDGEYIAIAYLGDDVADEEAFAELGDRGLKVLVRKEIRPTLADIILTPPQELLDFFDQWILNGELRGFNG
jgi:trehalose synthase